MDNLIRLKTEKLKTCQKNLNLIAFYQFSINFLMFIVRNFIIGLMPGFKILYILNLIYFPLISIKDCKNITGNKLIKSFRYNKTVKKSNLIKEDIYCLSKEIENLKVDKLSKVPIESIFVPINERRLPIYSYDELKQTKEPDLGFQKTLKM